MFVWKDKHKRKRGCSHQNLPPASTFDIDLLLFKHDIKNIFKTKNAQNTGNFFIWKSGSRVRGRFMILFSNQNKFKSFLAATADEW